MSTGKKETLTLQERMQVIKLGDEGNSTRAIAERFKVGKTQIQGILKRKTELTAEFEASAPLAKRRYVKATSNKPINDRLDEWYLDATRRGINITGPMLKEKALEFASHFGITTFSASNGWLQSFTKRNSLAVGKIKPTKCFNKVGFTQPTPDEGDIPDVQVRVPERFDELSNALFGVPFARLPEIDQDLATCDNNPVDWDRPATDLLADLKTEDSEDDDEEDEKSETDSTINAVSTQKALSALRTLRLYLQQQKCLLPSLRPLAFIEEEIIVASRSATKQTTITNFFPKQSRRLL
ncbi:uncharacterized protein LOC118477905 [Aplysia californica]|uniref:Uncharacterized protein LOC118477905 n=1 Tax=Aplysia californica TaxID=6500 RepID=A0ABM1VVK1_APLCA|nr:uncharacterized protein LOC118477905 [Aplysia californica]